MLASSIRATDGWLFVSMLVGLSLVIASACVFNNYIDRDIDARMARTKKRATVTGEIQALAVQTYATILGLAGFGVLLIWTNLLTALVAAIGFISYVGLYGYYKRRSPFGTLVGSVSGAVPPVVGYVAVTDKLDSAAVILFLILVFWQMPHFYAIAMYRLSDYKAAKIPVLPAVRGLRRTKLSILAYIAAFTAAAICLTLFGYTGAVYLITALFLGLTWLVIGIRGFNSRDDTSWGRQMFAFSLLVITVLSIVIAFNRLLP